MENNKTDTKFLESTPKLINNILRDLRKIQNLAKESNVSDEHQKQLLSTIRKELEVTKKSFNSKDQSSKFRFK